MYVHRGLQADGDGEVVEERVLSFHEPSAHPRPATYVHSHIILVCVQLLCLPVNCFETNIELTMFS